MHGRAIAIAIMTKETPTTGVCVGPAALFDTFSRQSGCLAEGGLTRQVPLGLNLFNRVLRRHVVCPRLSLTSEQPSTGSNGSPMTKSQC